MGKRLKLLLLTVPLCSWAGPAWADYTLVLKNGRRITVQSYREEGRMIKFRGLGGDDRHQQRPDSVDSKSRPRGADPQTRRNFKGQQRPRRHRKAADPEEEKAKEEKEYQQKLIELTGQLKEVRIVIPSCFVERQARSQAS